MPPILKVQSRGLVTSILLTEGNGGRQVRKFKDEKILIILFILFIKQCDGEIFNILMVVILFSGANHPDCKICVFMGKTDFTADRTKQQVINQPYFFIRALVL